MKVVTELMAALCRLPCIFGKGKGKVHHRKGHEGPEWE